MVKISSQRFTYSLLLIPVSSTIFPAYRPVQEEASCLSIRPKHDHQRSHDRSHLPCGSPGHVHDLVKRRKTKSQRRWSQRWIRQPIGRNGNRQRCFQVRRCCMCRTGAPGLQSPWIRFVCSERRKITNRTKSLVSRQ